MQIEITDLIRIDVRPGDVFLLRIPGHVTEATIAVLKEAWRGKFPDNEIIVATGGVEVAVIRDESRADA